MHAIVLADDAAGAATSLAVRSFRRHHPGAAVTVVQCDPLAPPVGLAATMDLPARGLRIGGVRYIDARLAGGDAFARWAAIPSILAAIAPQETALVVSARSWVLGKLDDVIAAVEPTQIGLVPRRSDPSTGISSGGWVPDLVVVGAEATDTLRWWQRRAVDVLADINGLLGVDLEDPWTAFLGGGPSVRCLDDPGIRVAPSTVAALALTTTGPPGAPDDDTTNLDVDGRPLRLVSFPAFDVDRPWWYSTSADTDPPVLASANPALRRLCLDYAVALGTPRRDRSERRGAASTGGQHTGAIGIRLTPTLRAAYRERLVEALTAAASEPPTVLPPNIFDPDDAEAFVAWLRGPGDHDGSGVSLAADLILRDRPDVAAAFPNIRWSGREGFLRWLWTSGLGEGLITTALLPELPAFPQLPAPAAPAARGALPAPERRFGVNLVGYHDSDLGLGVAVRRVGAALDAAQVPWTKVTYDRTHSRRRRAEPNRTDAPYWFNLILIAPDQLQFFADDVGVEFLVDHHNIGLWYWETDVLTDRQQSAFTHVDEVWGSTRYLVDVFAAHTDKPVHLIPVPLEFEHAPSDPATRERLGLDDRFTFLFTFDFFSIVERKNPLDLVAAYCEAFGPDDGARLVLKSINGARHLDQSEELRAAIADRPDIDLWDRYLDADDRLALVANVDCYVSLHRSEGLGLTMAEAMAAGTPVIATSYSGNLDFMPAGSALLVDQHEVEIGDGSFYPAHGHWAQPDLAHATALMRQVRSDAALRASLAVAGPAALRPFTSKRVGATIASHLRSVWQ